MTRLLEGLIETLNEFESGGNPLNYFTKGHVDKQEFAAEVRCWCAELDGKADWWDSTDYNEEDVEHLYWRNVPAGRDMPGCFLVYPCDGPARGAYKVTAIDIHKADWQRRMKQKQVEQSALCNKTGGI